MNPHWRRKHEGAELPEDLSKPSGHRSALAPQPEGRLFTIWSEGYAATGESSGAVCLGHGRGKTFKQACKNRAATDPEFRKHFSAKRMTYWGCKLFDNESSARRSYG